MYYVNPADPRGPEPKPEERDVQFLVWEEAIKKWAERENITVSEVPTEYDTAHKDGNKPLLNILSPKNNGVVASPNLTINVSTSAEWGLSRVEYYTDNHLIDFVTSYPYNLSAPIGYLSNGEHNLLVRACDVVENCAEQSVKFNMNISSNESESSLNLAWVSPGGGVLKKSDFPIELKALSYQPKNIRSVTFYALKLGGGILQPVATAQNIANNEITALWQTPPQFGVYKIFAEALGVNGSRIKTNVVRVTVTE